MSGEVPEGWSFLRLGGIAKIVTGKTPSTKDPENWGGDIPFVTPSDLNGSVYIGTTERSLTRSGAAKLSLLPANSVLYTCIASIGKSGVNTVSCVSNQQINACVFDTENDHLFHYYQLQRCTNALEALAGKTAVSIINKSKFSDFEVLCPPLPEQKRIAEILSSVDESIRATEAVITQAERVKRGLMEDLLTGGLGSAAIANGEVPEGWSIQRLDDLLTVFRNGFSCKQSKVQEGGTVPVSRIETISSGQIDVTRLGFASYSPKMESYKIIKGDILFSHINSIEHVGKTAFADSDMDFYHAMNLMLLRADRGKILPTYLFEALNSERCRDHFREHSKKAVNQVSLNKENIGSLTVPLPPLPEQHRIADIFTYANAQITTNRATVEQLQRLKRGLMDDLLTGKVRTVA